MDVGQGDSILIQAPNGQTMLVDGGRTIDMADRVILPQLKAWGAQQVDVLVVTHPDADHISGLVGVLEKFPVALVALTGDQHATQIYERLLTDIRDKNIDALKVRTGTPIPFDPAVKLEVLGPDDAGVNQDNTNDGSIVIKLTYGANVVPADGRCGICREPSPSCGAAPMCAARCLSWGIMAVRPAPTRTGCVPCSRSWVSSAPARTTPTAIHTRKCINALNKLGIPYIRTDEHGTITVTSDGAQLRVTSQK